MLYLQFSHCKSFGNAICALPYNLVAPPSSRSPRPARRRPPRHAHYRHHRRPPPHLSRDLTVVVLLPSSLAPRTSYSLRTRLPFPPHRAHDSRRDPTPARPQISSSSLSPPPLSTFHTSLSPSPTLPLPPVASTPLLTSGFPRPYWRRKFMFPILQIMSHLTAHCPRPA